MFNHLNHLQIDSKKYKRRVYKFAHMHFLSVQSEDLARSIFIALPKKQGEKASLNNHSNKSHNKTYPNSDTDTIQFLTSKRSMCYI